MRVLGLAPQARIALPAGMRVAGLALAGSHLAWSGCLPCAGAAQDATEVYVADLPAGRPRAVARTEFRWGSTSVIGVSGDTLVWLDEADVRDGDALRSHWALRALDLRTRAPGRSPREAGRVTPNGSRSPSPGRPRHLATVRPARPRRPGVVRRPRHPDRPRRHRSLPGLLRAVTARGLVYTSYEPDGIRDADAPVLADAYLLPAGGGRATALTAPTRSRTPSRTTSRCCGPRRTATTRRCGRGRSRRDPTLVFTGPVLSFVPGSDFAAWTTREADPVVEVGNGGAPLALPDVPAEGGVLTADGERVALLTVPDRGLSGPLTLVVLGVTTRG